MESCLEKDGVFFSTDDQAGRVVDRSHCVADVCILSEAHETGAALRLRAAVPEAAGWQIVRSSRTQHRGGGVAILFRRDEFKFHAAEKREDAEVITLTSFLRKLTIIGAYVTNSSHIKRLR